MTSTLSIAQTYHQECCTHLRMQDLAQEDRPREKLIQKGAQSLSEAELLGILIGSGTQEMSAVSLGQVLLKHYDNDLGLLSRCSVRELQRFKGIGEAKAVAIASAMELCRRKHKKNTPSRPCFHDSRSIYQYIKPELEDKFVEEFWVLLLNRANYLIKKHFISSGGFANTLADPKVIFGAALEYKASSIVLIHNHPSGNPEPSSKDIELTKKLMEGGETLDINVLDHIIVAGSFYFSFVDDRLLFNSMPTAMAS